MGTTLLMATALLVAIQGEMIGPTDGHHSPDDKSKGRRLLVIIMFQTPFTSI
jgi:hypothetical protein